MISRRRLLAATALVLGAVMPGQARAQDSALVVERVVAMVGKRPITQTMVDEQFFASYSPAARGRLSPDQIQKSRRAILDTLMGEEAVFQQALTDTTIKVTDQEVAEVVDKQLKGIRAGYPSLIALTRELREIGYRDFDEYRSSQIQQTRRNMYIGRFLTSLRESGVIKPLNPTEREIRAYYDAAVAAQQMTMLPPSLTFRQIVIAPKPTAAALARAKQVSDSLVLALRNGADFSTVARRFSMDPGSKDLGGDLGWHSKGASPFVREFEDAAFRLKPGEISPSVQTPFGYHVIQIQRVQGQQAHIFHILIMPEMDNSTAGTAQALADSVRRLIVGGASIDSLQRVHHDMIEARGADSPYPIDSLQPFYGPVKSLKVGEVSPVLTLGDPAAGAVKFAVVQVTGLFPEGPIPYLSVREQMRASLASQFGQSAYVKELLSKTFVDIREP